MYSRRVSKHVALNPVARAVARKALAESITTRKIQLYMMEPGDPCAEVCSGIGMTLTVLAFAAELDPRVGAEHPLVRVVRGAISACSQMADVDRYDPINTVAIDTALDAAVELNSRVKPEFITRAWNTLNRLGV